MPPTDDFERRLAEWRTAAFRHNVALRNAQRTMNDATRDAHVLAQIEEQTARYRVEYLIGRAEALPLVEARGV